MPEISILILMLLWLVSFLGISAFVMRIFQLKSETAPLVALSFLSVGLNLFGMIGWLQTAAFAFYLTGLAFFAYTAFKQKRSFLKLLLSPVSVVCLIWIVYLIVRLRNYLPYENDDLSHWALAAREILRTNAYPDASCEILSFSAYPLSSAVNIYYFCRFIGNHEWLYAFAQAFYRLIAFLPLLSLVRKNRVFGYVSFALGFLFISRAGGYIASLRVDPLLTAYGIGAFAAVLSSDTKKSRTLIALLPLMIMQTLTKNSGIFFAVTQALALALMVSKQSGKHQGLRAFLIGSGASAASLGIWLFYVSCVFSSGLSTKHAVSLSAYIHNALDKGLETTLKIARAFFGALCTPLPSDLMIYALFALALAFMGLMIRAFHKQKLVRPLLEMLGFLASVYVCYLLFLFGMYIVSMPEKEALAAASFTRYHRTITLYMGGCALAFV